MIVLKFGGSSVRDAARMRAVAELVRAALPERPLVVLSAIGGVTDSLLELGRAADKAASAVQVEAIAFRHRALLADLELPTDLLDPLLGELAALGRGIVLIGEVSPRTVDKLVSYGERCSVRVFAALLAASGIPATAVDAWDLGLVSDGRFGGARVLPPDRAAVARALEAVAGVPVVTGYMTKSEAGEITTFGRSGSDYSASAIGSAIGAREVQIWTDVDGVMSADPRVVEAAQPIELLSFAEASEVAYYGAKVLHPATIQPAVKDAIPVRVKNTFRPDAPGTLIMLDPPAADRAARCVVHKRGVTLVDIASTKMLAQHGFLAQIFEVFARHGVVIDMVATSEVTVSATCDAGDGVALAAAINELETFATVVVERELAMVSLVGRGFRGERGISARVFGALYQAGVGVRMISAGGSKINVSFLVAGDKADPAVRALHAEFIEGRPQSAITARAAQ